MDVLRSGNEILKGTTVNGADVKKIARQIKAQYGSRISVDEAIAKEVLSSKNETVSVKQK